MSTIKSFYSYFHYLPRLFQPSQTYKMALQFCETRSCGLKILTKSQILQKVQTPNCCIFPVPCFPSSPHRFRSRRECKPQGKGGDDRMMIQGKQLRSEDLIEVGGGIFIPRKSRISIRKKVWRPKFRIDISSATLHPGNSSF